MDELEVFDKIKIGLASDEKIREWSHGEVKKPETINYRTLKPDKDGLFCEKIFGPTKDWECYCGKYKRVRYKGIVCDRCGVEVTKSKVRRERMGHIELAAPVAHIWYFKGIPSRIALVLDISPRNLEKVIYFASYIVTDKGNTGLMKCQVLTEKEYHDAQEQYGRKSFTAEMGAEAILKLLKEVNLEEISIQLKKEIRTASEQKKVKLAKRLDTIESFRLSGNKPEWMVMNVVPVIPPELRPMVQLDGGRFATSDLNDLYRRVINRNNRLKKLLELGAPDIIVRNEKRMLQESVDALIDNGRRGRPVTGAGNRPLKSLSDMLKGKQGRFRQNLLGKRVDYSGRSVIVVGPELKMYQCGVPKEMAVELFKPFVMKELVQRGIAHNIKNAKRKVEKLSPEVWGILEEVIKDHPVMLNRAPTLHRLGIQAFEPVLVEGRALKLHPLVCTPFNADFDGDQMAIHLPLSPEAQAEARYLMLSVNNLLKPQDGKPVTVPTQDMILGSYYLTMETSGEKGEGSYYKDPEEALLAYENKEVGIHAKVFIRMTKVINGVKKTKRVETTVGRVIYNQGIPQDLGFVDRTDPEHEFDLEISFPVIKKNLGKIVAKCIDTHGLSEAAVILDYIKATGFKYSTLGAITVSAADVKVPPQKKDILAAGDRKVEEIKGLYDGGFITDEERYEEVIKVWDKVTNEVSKAMEDNFAETNPIYMMAQSGARGNMNQLRQIAGMRGLMANTQGKAVEIPIKACFREGLDPLEYFVSAHGGRKGLADTALRTADSGYLTRRLVDVSQDIIVRDIDCGTKDGIIVEDIKDGNQILEKLEERLEGRYVVEDILDPETKEVIVDTDTMITPAIANRIVAVGYKKVKIRSALACRSKHGVCTKCYGMGLATRQNVSIGEAVGIIAAQSIGEPGTQLTMRTFHQGGVAGGDITQGLPRVEELFEARKPKGLATITEIAGTVKIEDENKNKKITVTSEDKESKTYIIPFGSKLCVKEGQKVEAAEALTEGSINPNEILAIKGPSGVYNYLIQEVQKVYRNQGVDINDKHIEVIGRQMLKKVRVEDNGDTEMFPGSLIDMYEFEDNNNKVIAEGKKPAVGKRALLGITKAALATDSFLSAASFQETTRVLTEAAIKGKVDPLIGLKENVIIGKLIPAGTGLNVYKDVEINTDKEDIAKDLDDENEEENLVNEESTEVSESDAMEEDLDKKLENIKDDDIND